MANKITFSHEQRDFQTDELVKTYNMTVHEGTLGELIEDFEMFLRGCGFVLPEGTMLDVVEDPSYTKPQAHGLETFFGDGHDGMGSTLEDYPELKTKSNFYFDTTRNK